MLALRKCALLAVAVCALAVLTACATYSQDLERARAHYEANDFPSALAVLRLLGEDADALSPTERAEFAYLRGMTDLRIGATLADERRLERQAFRACARDWLEVALRSPTARAPALGPAEAARARAALAEIYERDGSANDTHPTGACTRP